MSNSHRRDVPLARDPPGFGGDGRSGRIARVVVGRGRGRKNEERSAWRGRRRWRGELDFSDSKFCSSLFPSRTNAGATATDASPPSTTADPTDHLSVHPLPPSPFPPFTPPLHPGGGSRVSPSGAHPVPPSSPLTSTTHSFLRSSRRPRLALFFLPSAHERPRRAAILPLPLSSFLPARFPLNHHLLLRLHLARPDRSNQWHCRHNKNGKKSDGCAHISRSYSLALSLSLRLSPSLSRIRDDGIPDAFEKLFMKRPTRFLERRVFFSFFF